MMLEKCSLCGSWLFEVPDDLRIDGVQRSGSNVQFGYGGPWASIHYCSALTTPTKSVGVRP